MKFYLCVCVCVCVFFVVIIKNNVLTYLLTYLLNTALCGISAGYPLFEKYNVHVN